MRAITATTCRAETLVPNQIGASTNATAGERVLEIEDIGYSRTFTVPALDFVVLPSVESDFDYRFPLQTEV